jgi:DNA-binding transcriptional LysR family regulator
MDGMPGMDGMPAGDSSPTTGGVSMMQSVFQNIRSTPLYSLSWTPTSTGAYAGTCIFLVLLATLMRVLLAGKSYLEARWLDRELNRRYVVVNGGRPPLAQRLSQESDVKRAVLSENGLEEDVFVVGRKKAIVRPWRVSVDPLRALIDMVIAGVGYLL